MQRAEGTQHQPPQGEMTMAYGRGHTTGQRKERKGSTDWFKAIEEEYIKKLETEWQQKQQS